MEPLIQAFLMSFVLTPLDQASFPSHHEIYRDTILKQSIAYSWETPRSISSTALIGAQAGYVTKVLLDPDHMVERMDHFDMSGRLISQDTHINVGGRLAETRKGREVSRLFYRDGLLDSAAISRDDTLMGYFTYTYDSEKRLVGRVRNSNSSGIGVVNLQTQTISYFLPDSMVVEFVFAPPSDITGKHVLYLSGNRLVKIVSSETFNGATDVLTQIWKYADANPVRRRERSASYRIPDAGFFGGGDVLGRTPIRNR